MSAQKCTFFRDGVEITEGIELRNGKATLSGFSFYEVWQVRPETYPGATNEEKIAEFYCGFPQNPSSGITFRVEPDGAPNA